MPKGETNLYGNRMCALIVKIQEYTNKCTVLKCKEFAIKKQDSGIFPQFHAVHPYLLHGADSFLRS
jgi:hypothetical protein